MFEYIVRIQQFWFFAPAKVQVNSFRSYYLSIILKYQNPFFFVFQFVLLQNKQQSYRFSQIEFKIIFPFSEAGTGVEMENVFLVHSLSKYQTFDIDIFVGPFDIKNCIHYDMSISCQSSTAISFENRIEMSREFYNRNEKTENILK